MDTSKFRRDGRCAAYDMFLTNWRCVVHLHGSVAWGFCTDRLDFQFWRDLSVITSLVTREWSKVGVI